jgi:hypothetical protein
MNNVDPKLITAQIVHETQKDEAAALLEKIKPIGLGEFMAKEIPVPPIIVDGLLRQGNIGLITGGSKSNKSWMAIDLGISVACEAPFLGQQTERGRVLIVDPELSDYEAQRRLTEVLRKKAEEFELEDLDANNLQYIGLRGRGVPPSRVLDLVGRIAEGGDYRLVIVDSIYRFLNGRQENAAEEVALLFEELDDLASRTRAAIVVVHHHSKGSQGRKSALDRSSGSGVFARFPDTIIDLTPHEEDQHFNVEAILREFPPMKPFVVEWVFPFMRRVDGVQAGKHRRPGAAPRYSKEQVLAALADGMNRKEWLEHAQAALGIGKGAFDQRRQELEKAGAVLKRSRKFYHAVDPGIGRLRKDGDRVILSFRETAVDISSSSCQSSPISKLYREDFAGRVRSFKEAAPGIPGNGTNLLCNGVPETNIGVIGNTGKTAHDADSFSR